MRIKICGVTDADDARSVILAGADAVGFLIGLNYPSADEIGWREAKQIIAGLSPFIASVLVTHQSDPVWVIETCRAVGCNAVQLHGEFSPEDLPSLRENIPNVKIIKTVLVRGPDAVEQARRAALVCDAILLDTATATRIGGTGRTHDWRISARIVASVSKPVILAGGLTPENVMKAIVEVLPYAVDVNSGVEFPDGRKSAARIRTFVTAARQAFATVSAEEGCGWIENQPKHLPRVAADASRSAPL